MPRLRSPFTFGLTSLILAIAVEAAEPPNPQRTVKVPEGWQMTVFAKPPEVGYPTSISVALDGTAFVAIDENGSLDAKSDRGRVVRCIDSDVDGVADKFSTVAKMDSPRGVIWEEHGKGGTLYVMHPPNLTAYYDVDGDGVAEKQEDLVTGLAFDLTFRGADHTINGIRLGIDGWIYIACGDYGAVEAKGKDGRTFNMKGGGVVRVRTDGTGLEFVSRGQRNIYDVAVSPTLDLFTRDNTNDGGGWNDRLSFVVMGGNYGYPSLFRYFPEEAIPALADYGGGSPTGAIWLDEPSLPAAAQGLYTVEWGRSNITHHLVKPVGAGWKDDPQEFLRLTRPTDIDVDAAGHLFITSWEGATYTNNGPLAGYVIRLTSKEAKPQTVPDLLRASDLELVKLIGSESHILRLAAQRELLRRPVKADTGAALLKLATDAPSIGGRVAAVFTLKQFFGERANDALLGLTKIDGLREYALRALTDDLRTLAKVPLPPFITALADANPRVRLQAVTGLGRLGKKETAPALLPLTADPDPLVAHVAIHFLVELKAVEASLAALDSPVDKIHPGALRVLQAIYEPAVVEGLTRRLGTNDPVLHADILRVLTRLDQKETPYKYGEWWSTRPDTSGPVYKGERWEGSPQIEATLKQQLDQASEAEARVLLTQMYRAKVSFPGLTELMLEKAGSDATAKLTAVEAMFSPDDKLPPEAIKVTLAIATNEKENPELRAKALRQLQRASDSAFDPVMAAFAPLAGHDLAHPTLTAAFDDFTRDPKHGLKLSALGKLATGDDSAKRTLAQTIVVNLATGNLTPAKQKANASQLVDKLWATPELAASLLGVIGRTHAMAYAEQVRAKLKDPDHIVGEAAEYALNKLGLDQSAAPAKLISTLPYEQVVAEVLSAQGDAAQGREIFLRAGCIACHTVSAAEPPKGPMLAAVVNIYDRKELLESILKPNAKIAQGFESQWFDTKKGEHVEGFVTREGGDSLDVRNIAGQSVTVEVGDIKERGKREQSMMPDGLLNGFTPKDLGALLAYLESLRAKK